MHDEPLLIDIAIILIAAFPLLFRGFPSKEVADIITMV